MALRVNPMSRSILPQGSQLWQVNRMGGSARSLVTIVAFVIFVDMLGIGLIIPVMPRLIGEMTGNGLRQAAEIGGALQFVYATVQFLCAPIIGGLSDRFGRRPILLTTLFLLG